MTWHGLPYIISQFTLLLTIVSAFVGLSVALMALRAIKSIPIRLRPFLLVGSCVVMVVGLVITRNLFYQE